MKIYRGLGILVAVCAVVAIVGSELIYSYFVVGGKEASDILNRVRVMPEMVAYFGEISEVTLSRQGTRWESGTNGRSGTYSYRVQGSKVSGGILVKWEQRPGSELVIREIRRAYLESADFIVR